MLLKYYLIYINGTPYERSNKKYTIQSIILNDNRQFKCKRLKYVGNLCVLIRSKFFLKTFFVKFLFTCLTKMVNKFRTGIQGYGNGR